MGRPARAAAGRRRHEPAQVLDVSLQLQPPPERRSGRDLAGMQQRGLPLPGPADPDDEVKPPGCLAGERLACLGSQAVGDAGRQGPGQHRQAQRSGGSDGRGRGGPVVRMAGDAGVVEDQQPAGMIPAGQPRRRARPARRQAPRPGDRRDSQAAPRSRHPAPPWPAVVPVPAAGSGRRRSGSAWTLCRRCSTGRAPRPPADVILSMMAPSPNDSSSGWATTAQHSRPGRQQPVWLAGRATLQPGGRSRLACAHPRQPPIRPPGRGKHRRPYPLYPQGYDMPET